ncbi:hypothetical protein [Devosia sp. Root635]|uniref:hypothetical protein n=1 Tax=Devosia sp. Root635 TaxID=1736575 RepID=UPI0012E3F8E5|nr:hypothetical protein [Devosia sp. Root635]
MTPARLTAVILFSVLATADGYAAPFQDPRSGIRVDVGDAYAIASEPVAGQPDASMIFINPRDTRHPFVPDSQTPMCVFTQWPDADFASMTQAEIDADAPNWPADIVADMAGTAALESAAPFEHQGLAGMEVVTRLTQSVTNEDYLVFFALATPAGRASLACAATDETLADALPVYRRVRDGITLPQ